MTTLTHSGIRQAGRYRDLNLEGVEPDVALALHRSMSRLRRCEEAILHEYHPADEMKCPVHFSIGQEAVPAVLSHTLRVEDLLFCHHRSHGYYFGKNAPMRAFIAELYGRTTGSNGGKAGSMELSYPSLNFYSGALLTGALAIATGAAFAFQLKKQPRIAVAGFGEAATEEGLFWETISYAALKKLPIVMICENNMYSVSSPQTKRQPKDDISARVAAFGVTAQPIFGNDVLEVWRTTRAAIQRARSGGGPTFIEAYTYRWCSHVGPESDDSIGYRVPEEIEFWKGNCPIELLEEKMLQAGWITPAAKTAMMAEIDTEVADAFAFAKSSPFPTSTDWGPMNLSPVTPEADRLLEDAEFGEFDQHQNEALLAPY